MIPARAVALAAPMASGPRARSIPVIHSARGPGQLVRAGHTVAIGVQGPEELSKRPPVDPSVVVPVQVPSQELVGAILPAPPVLSALCLAGRSDPEERGDRLVREGPGRVVLGRCEKRAPLLLREGAVVIPVGGPGDQSRSREARLPRPISMGCWTVPFPKVEELPTTTARL